MASGPSEASYSGSVGGYAADTFGLGPDAAPAPVASLTDPIDTSNVLYTLPTIEVTGNEQRDQNYFNAWWYSGQYGAPAPRPGMSDTDLRSLYHQQRAWQQNHPLTAAHQQWSANANRAVFASNGKSPMTAVGNRSITEAQLLAFRKQEAMNFLKFNGAIAFAGAGAGLASMSALAGGALSLYGMASGAHTLSNAETTSDYVIVGIELLGGALGLGVAAHQARAATSFRELVWMPLGPAGKPGSVSQLLSSAKTFSPQGVQGARAETYLATSDGRSLLRSIWAADPSASAEVVFARAQSYLASGASVPRLEIATSRLVKVVPDGQGVSPYSPFFTTESELSGVLSRGESIANAFALPAASEARAYSVFAIDPVQPAAVFVSPVARTAELGGYIRHSGGAVQYIVPNRGLWSEPVYIGRINN